MVLCISSAFNQRRCIPNMLFIWYGHLYHNELDVLDLYWFASSSNSWYGMDEFSDDNPRLQHDKNDTLTQYLRPNSIISPDMVLALYFFAGMHLRESPLVEVNFVVNTNAHNLAKFNNIVSHYWFHDTFGMIQLEHSFYLTHWWSLLRRPYILIDLLLLRQSPGAHYIQLVAVVCVNCESMVKFL